MFKKSIAALAALLLIPALLFAGSVDTSSTSAQSIINRARVLLQELIEDHWTDVHLLTFVNEGQVDIATQSLSMQTTEDINLVADQIEYTIVTDYITIEHVFYVNSDGDWKGLDKGHPADTRRTGESWNTVTEPAFWYEWGGKVGVFPPPSSVTTETIKLYLVSRPATLALTDNVTIPAVYDRALIRYITAQAFQDKRRFADAEYYMKEYQSEIDRYRQDFNELDKK